MNNAPPLGSVLFVPRLWGAFLRTFLIRKYKRSPLPIPRIFSPPPTANTGSNTRLRVMGSGHFIRSSFPFAITQKGALTTIRTEGGGLSSHGLTYYLSR